MLSIQSILYLQKLVDIKDNHWVSKFVYIPSAYASRLDLFTSCWSLRNLVPISGNHKLYRHLNILSLITCSVIILFLVSS